MSSDQLSNVACITAPLVAAVPFTVVDSHGNERHVRSRSSTPRNEQGPNDHSAAQSSHTANMFQQMNQQSNVVTQNQLSQMQQQLNSIMNANLQTFNQQQINFVAVPTVATENTVTESQVSAIVNAHLNAQAAQRQLEAVSAAAASQEAVIAHAGAALQQKELEMKQHMEAYMNSRLHELQSMFSKQIEQQRSEYEVRLQTAQAQAQAELHAMKQREQALQLEVNHREQALRQEVARREQALQLEASQREQALQLAASQEILQLRSLLSSQQQTPIHPQTPRRQTATALQQNERSPTSVRMHSPDPVCNWLEGQDQQPETPAMVRNLLAEFDSSPVHQAPPVRPPATTIQPFTTQADPQAQALQAQVVALGNMVQQLLNAQLAQATGPQQQQSAPSTQVPRIQLPQTTTLPHTTFGQGGNPPSPSSFSSSSSSSSSGSDTNRPGARKGPPPPC